MLIVQAVGNKGKTVHHKCSFHAALEAALKETQLVTVKMFHSTKVCLRICKTCSQYIEAPTVVVSCENKLMLCQDVVGCSKIADFMHAYFCDAPWKAKPSPN